ncbi:hypothetical protein BDN71DRAFT_1433285 [Pleurotus eryngii]|uniref:Uncharacterized protein n=1 Tax=Pleurotus eryngii TaxID=5323 RepID=A0A9P5ZRK9_PLEER|nr:hypothetical protein BDN71DRAFT_1433285 [Pleurotus eryngii]
MSVDCELEYRAIEEGVERDQDNKETENDGALRRLIRARSRKSLRAIDIGLEIEDLSSPPPPLNSDEAPPKERTPNKTKKLPLPLPLPPAPTLPAPLPMPPTRPLSRPRPLPPPNPSNMKPTNSRAPLPLPLPPTPPINSTGLIKKSSLKKRTISKIPPLPLPPTFSPLLTSSFGTNGNTNGSVTRVPSPRANSKLGRSGNTGIGSKGDDNDNAIANANERVHSIGIELSVTRKSSILRRYGSIHRSRARLTADPNTNAQWKEEEINDFDFEGEVNEIIDAYTYALISAPAVTNASFGFGLGSGIPDFRSASSHDGSRHSKYSRYSKYSKGDVVTPFVGFEFVTPPWYVMAKGLATGTSGAGGMQMRLSGDYEYDEKDYGRTPGGYPSVSRNGFGFGFDEEREEMGGDGSFKAFTRGVSGVPRTAHALSLHEYEIETLSRNGSIGSVSRRGWTTADEERKRNLKSGGGSGESHGRPMLRPLSIPSPSSSGTASSKSAHTRSGMSTTLSMKNTSHSGSGFRAKTDAKTRKSIYPLSAHPSTRASRAVTRQYTEYTYTVGLGVVAGLELLDEGGDSAGAGGVGEVGGGGLLSATVQIRSATLHSATFSFTTKNSNSHPKSGLSTGSPLASPYWKYPTLRVNKNRFAADFSGSVGDVERWFGGFGGSLEGSDDTDEEEEVIVLRSADVEELRSISVTVSPIEVDESRGFVLGRQDEEMEVEGMRPFWPSEGQQPSSPPPRLDIQPFHEPLDVDVSWIHEEKAQVEVGDGQARPQEKPAPPPPTPLLRDEWERDMQRDDEAHMAGKAAEWEPTLPLSSAPSLLPPPVPPKLDDHLQGQGTTGAGGWMTRFVEMITPPNSNDSPPPFQNVVNAEGMPSNSGVGVSGHGGDGWENVRGRLEESVKGSGRNEGAVTEKDVTDVRALLAGARGFSIGSPYASTSMSAKFSSPTHNRSQSESALVWSAAPPAARSPHGYSATRTKAKVLAIGEKGKGIGKLLGKKIGLTGWKREEEGEMVISSPMMLSEKDYVRMWEENKRGATDDIVSDKHHGKKNKKEKKKKPRVVIDTSWDFLDGGESTPLSVSAYSTRGGGMLVLSPLYSHLEEATRHVGVGIGSPRLGMSMKVHTNADVNDSRLKALHSGDDEGTRKRGRNVPFPIGGRPLKKRSTSGSSGNLSLLQDSKGVPRRDSDASTSSSRRSGRTAAPPPLKGPPPSGPLPGVPPPPPPLSSPPSSSGTSESSGECVHFFQTTEPLRVKVPRRIMVGTAL